MSITNIILGGTGKDLYNNPLCLMIGITLLSIASIMLGGTGEDLYNYPLNLMMR